MSDTGNLAGAAEQGAAMAGQMPQEKARELGVKQQKAMAALAAGKTLGRAAFEADVNRRTLLRWRKENPEFAAEMKRWKAAARREARAILADDLATAARAVTEAVEAGDGYLGMQLLRASGVFRRVGHMQMKPAAPAGMHQP